MLSTSARALQPAGVMLSTSGRALQPAGVMLSTSGRALQPAGATLSTSGRALQPAGVKLSTSGRRLQPAGATLSTSGRPLQRVGQRLQQRGPPAAILTDPPFQWIPRYNPRIDQPLGLRRAPGPREAPGVEGPPHSPDISLTSVARWSAPTLIQRGRARRWCGFSAPPMSGSSARSAGPAWGQQGAGAFGARAPPGAALDEGTSQGPAPARSPQRPTASRRARAGAGAAPRGWPELGTHGDTPRAAARPAADLGACAPPRPVASSVHERSVRGAAGRGRG
jgi:hypothetical protein